VNISVPFPTVEQIAADRTHLATWRYAQTLAVGTVIRQTHDLNDVGKIPFSNRWMRVWQLTESGWLFLGMAQGFESPNRQI